MNPYIKAQYNQHLIKYLNQLLNIEIKNDKKAFVCPICQKEESALIYPNNVTKFYCLNPICDLINICHIKTENIKGNISKNGMKNIRKNLRNKLLKQIKKEE